MARPQIPAGELGKIDVKLLPSGRYRARATSRDDSGALHRLAATADTKEGAHAGVRRQAMAMTTGGDHPALDQAAEWRNGASYPVSRGRELEHGRSCGRTRLLRRGSPWTKHESVQCGPCPAHP